jgi:ABC-type nitrate/sulfonate/bicarbonate transport system ATPase subunit
MIVAAEGVTKQFGDLEVLRGVSLRVAEGERVGLLGPSGCGKTTLLRILLGLESRDGGSVDSRLRRAGYLPQDTLLLPWKTVLENVALPLQIRRVRLEARHATVLNQLDRFGLSGFENAYPHELSGGMRQRAALLRAVTAGAESLVLDEPLGALDTLTRLQLQDWLRELAEDLGLALLFVTHDLDEAIVLSDRIVVLSERPARNTADVTVELTPEARSSRWVGSFLDVRGRLTALILEERAHRA